MADGYGGSYGSGPANVSAGGSYGSGGYGGGYGAAAGNGSTGYGHSSGPPVGGNGQWSSQSGPPAAAPQQPYGSSSSYGSNTGGYSSSYGGGAGGYNQGSYGSGGYGGGSQNNYSSNAPAYPGPPSSQYNDRPPMGGGGGPPSGFRGGLGGGGGPVRGSGPGFRGGLGGGPRNFSSNFGDTEQQQDTVFVTGLPEDVNDDQIAEFFGAIGIIKIDKKTSRPKIWIYRDKATGRGKGEATVTYDDPPTASSAIQWFNGKDFHGSMITVSLAERKSFGPPGGGFRGGRGGGGPSRGGPGGFGGGRGGGGGSGGREGDWKCPNDECNNNNFAWRTACNRCQEPKPEGLDGPGMGGGGYDRGGRGGYGDRDGGFRGGRGGGPMRGGRGGFDRGRGGFDGGRGRGGFDGGRGGRGGYGGGFGGPGRQDRRPAPY